MTNCGTKLDGATLDTGIYIVCLVRQKDNLYSGTLTGGARPPYPHHQDAVRKAAPTVLFVTVRLEPWKKVVLLAEDVREAKAV